MKEKIIEMLKIQEALDNSFMQYKGRTEPLKVDEVRKALFDELGEVNHAMKADWCYWKKSQSPVDREEVKKELADVWHFALTLHRLKNGFKFNKFLLKVIRFISKKQDVYSIMDVLTCSRILHLYLVVILTEKLGFSFDEIYCAYIEKNKENYERMKRGY